jgi:hypothetical protein
VGPVGDHDVGDLGGHPFAVVAEPFLDGGVGVAAPHGLDRRVKVQRPVRRHSEPLDSVEDVVVRRTWELEPCE